MPITAIKAPAGLGKTEEYVLAVAFSILPLIEIYVPTIELAEEVKVRIQQHNPDKRVTVIRGRSAPDAEGKPICRRSEIADILIKTGLSVFNNLCLRKQSNGHDPVKCEHFDECTYIQQFHHTEVRIYAHAYLPLGRNMLEGNLPDAVIIDESFWQVCIDENVPFNAMLLAHPDIPNEAKPLCRDILSNILTDLDAARIRVQDATDSDEYMTAVRALRRANTTINPAMADDDIAATLKKSNTFTPIVQLLELLRMESQFNRPVQTISYDRQSGSPLLHIKKSIRRFREKGLRAAFDYEPPILVLDANASQLILSQFFEIKRFEEHHVKRKAHVTQCYSTRASTTSLVPERNENETYRAAAQQKLDQIQTWLDALAADGSCVLVVGPSSIVGNPREKKPALLRCPPNGYLAHYNAIRGIDKWKDFDIVVIIGRNQPPTEAVENKARALFSNDAVPLKLTGVWSEAERRYYYDDGSEYDTGVMVPVHADDRINSVLHQLRECESEQSVDRLRLIHCEHPKKVYLLADLPLDIDVHELRTFAEIVGGGNRLELAWDRLNAGVLPLSGKWLADRFPDLWKTEESARRGVERDRGEMKTGQSPNGIFIRGLSGLTYQYRLPGQRGKPSYCLSIHPDLESTREALQKLLGGDILVRECPG
jgi:hypothetical protein